MQQRFCENCGSERDVSDKFCTKCGNKFSAGENQQAIGHLPKEIENLSADEPPVQHPTVDWDHVSDSIDAEEVETSKYSDSKSKILGFGVILIMLVGVGWLLLGSSNQPKAGSNQFEEEIGFQDIQTCAPNEALAHLFEQLESQSITGTGDNRPIELLSASEPLVVERRSRRLGEGYVERSAFVRMPEGSTWNELKFSRVMVSTLFAPEDSRPVETKYELRFFDSTDRVQDVIRQVGFLVPVAPSSHSITDAQSRMYAMAIERLNGGSGLACKGGDEETESETSRATRSISIDQNSPFWNYRSRVNNAANSTSNFDRDATISTWGCGTDCKTGVLVDRTSGTVTWLPVGGEGMRNLTLNHQVGDNLMVASWEEGSLFDDQPICGFTAFLWSDGQFVELEEFPIKLRPPMGNGRADCSDALGRLRELAEYPNDPDLCVYDNMVDCIAEGAWVQ